MKNAYQNIGINLTEEHDRLEFMRQISELALGGGWFGVKPKHTPFTFEEEYFGVIWEARPPWDVIASPADWKSILKKNPLLPGPHRYGEKWLKKFSKLSEKDRTVSVHRDIKFGKKFFWFAPFSDIVQTKQQAGSDPATSCRDRLGLIHHQKGKGLLLFRIPGKILSEKKVHHARPTFVESVGQHSRFAAMSQDPNTTPDDPYGRTIDLDIFRKNGDLADGIRERVCTSLDSEVFGSNKICLEFLGWVAYDCGSDNDDDQTFSSKLAGKMTDNDIFQFLMGVNT